MLNKHIDAQKTVTLCFRKKKKVQILFDLHLLCGERGIRTPGASQHGSFQDCCNRPLYHLSSGCRLLPETECKSNAFF